MGVSPPTSRATSWSRETSARKSFPSCPNGRGMAPVRNFVAQRPCTAPLRAVRPFTFWVRPLSTVTRSRNGSRGARMGENANPAPSPAGVHSSMTTPLGM